MAVSRNDPFHSAKSRLARAEEKISELDTAIWEYRNKHPPELICEADEPNRRTKTYKFKFTSPFPDSWTHLPLEILEATRSSLDQCAYAAAKLSGNTRLRRTQFPIADTADNLKNLIVRRKICADVPAGIVDVFLRFKPYKGGSDTLWALNKLRNSTHTQLVPIAVRGANIRIHHSPRSTGDLTALDPVFDSTKFELPFARSAVDAHHAFSATPTFNIGFEQTFAPNRRHAVSFLTAGVNEASEIVDAVELACCQLGFIDAPADG
jgi:hypothetical protein